MKKSDKRGQFYLIAAIVVVGIMVGSIAIVNYSKKESSVVVDELKNELKIETQKVLDYDETHSGSEQIRNFGQEYSEYRSEIEIYFITGENPDIDAYKYLDGNEASLSDDVEVDSQNDKITFTLENKEYEFDLTSGKNFYFIVSQKIKGESYIATG